MKLKYLLFFLVFPLPALFPLEKIGQVTALTGEVYFDIQGNGDFVKLQTDDILYDQSVIKTGKDGLVVIKINNKEVKLPPFSTIYMTDIIRTEPSRHNIDKNVYEQLLNLLAAALKSTFVHKEKKEKGTIEVRGTEESATDFISEASIEARIDEQFLNGARNALLKKEYAHALLQMAAIKQPAVLKTFPDDCNFLKALCYFFLGHYRQAEENFSLTISNAGVKQEKTVFGKSVLFLLPAGVTYYLLGQNDRAIDYLIKNLQLKNDPELKPYTYYFLCSALIHADRRAEAKNFLRDALKLYKEHPLCEEWQRLLAAL